MSPRTRLRRSDLSRPGLRRRRRGKGFSYTDTEGRPVDADTRRRIEQLVIPPAWRDVWISPHPNGHIQAAGTDDAGRRQYLYHRAWTEQRAVAKHERVLALARRLPRLRRALEADLSSSGLNRDRVLALAIRLLDSGQFRTGGEEYEQENGSYGVATMQAQHAQVRGGAVEFSYRAKAGQELCARVEDPVVARTIRALQRGAEPTERLLRYRDRAGWHDVHPADINSRFKDLVGDEFSVKDLRTWSATVEAAAELAAAEEPGTLTAQRRAVKAAMDGVADLLGNTPTVARGSYVDPRVIEEYEEGNTIPASRGGTAGPPTDLAALRRRELAVIRLLQGEDEGNEDPGAEDDGNVDNRAADDGDRGDTRGADDS